MIAGIHAFLSVLVFGCSLKVNFLILGENMHRKS